MMKRVTISYLIISILITQLDGSLAKQPPILSRRQAQPDGTPQVLDRPILINCPDNYQTRVVEEAPWPLSTGEAEYVAFKAKKDVPLWEQYLSPLALEDFDITRFLDSAHQKGGIAGETLPNIGFAISGGGSRAMLYGASMLDAFDSRNPEAVEAGIGGILQLANYAAGISGAGWFLTSWATANYLRIPELQQTSWKFSEKDDYISWRRIKHLKKYISKIRKKKKAGFPVSFVDLWGQILSQQFIQKPDSHKNLLFSSIRKVSAYRNHEFPMPMLIATSRRGNKENITLQSPIYEITPHDFGVWHPTLNASISIEYLGSKSAHGNSNPASCTQGFDDAGFLMGISSNVFSSQDGPGSPDHLMSKFLNLFVDGSFYEALVPNPFYGRNANMTPGSGFDDSGQEVLLLADGAMATENLPLFPLIQPSRKVDVILAIDSTVNGCKAHDHTVPGYPNGTTLYRTYQKIQHPDFQGYAFPSIPNPFNNSFILGGYNKRPTFFGCDMKESPLIIYLPNYFVTDSTDMPTMKSDYTTEQIQGFFRNSFMIASQSNSSDQNIHSNWSKCLGCGLIDKQQRRSGIPRTSQCQKCFNQYCAT